MTSRVKALEEENKELKSEIEQFGLSTLFWTHL
jgi:hypothetical protein